MTRNILITGVAGFIGSNFVYHYLDSHPDRTVIGYDNLTYAGNLDNLSAIPGSQRNRFIFIKGDICDQDRVEEVFQEYRIEGVINFAAESYVDRSIRDPRVFMRSNILGTGVLLDTALKFWQESSFSDEDTRFLQVSTDEVYGSLGPDGYFTEDTPLNPHNPYSASKASADLLASAYHDTYRLPVIITRCSNNYGPYQFPEKLVPLVITKALDHQPIPVYGDGRQVRDWLYVQDHCIAVDLTYERGGIGEIYNIGGNNELENLDLIRLVLSELSRETGDFEINENLIRHVADRPGHDRRYAIDSGKIRRVLGWNAATRFDEGIKKTIRWYLENKTWLQRVASGNTGETSEWPYN
ncbi:MAG: dTDP-glucose 4,6-dehydratase [Methanoregulaceae archaeon]